MKEYYLGKKKKCIRCNEIKCVHAALWPLRKRSTDDVPLWIRRHKVRETYGKKKKKGNGR